MYEVEDKQWLFFLFVCSFVSVFNYILLNYALKSFDSINQFNCLME